MRHKLLLKTRQMTQTFVKETLDEKARARHTRVHVTRYYSLNNSPVAIG